jgi:hypothetical protein
MTTESSWAADNYSVGQEIPCLYTETNIHQHIHRIPPLYPTVSAKSNPHPHPPYDLHLCQQRGLPLKFSKQNFVGISEFPYACYISCKSHSYCSPPTILSKELKLWSALLSKYVRYFPYQISSSAVSSQTPPNLYYSFQVTKFHINIQHTIL